MLLRTSTISLKANFYISESESECQCLTCNQKPTGSQFSLLHELNKKVNGKNIKKTIEQSSVHKGSPTEEVGSVAGRIQGKCIF